MATRSNARLLVKKARALCVPEEILEKLHTESHERGGVHHHQRGWCRALSNGSYREKNLAAAPVTLLQLAEGEVCKDCEGRIMYGGSTTSALLLLGDLVVGADLAKSAERYVAKHDQKPDTNGRLRKLQDEIKQHRKNLAALSTIRLGELQGVATEVDDLLQCALAELEELSGGDAQREKISSRIRNELIPSQYRKTVTLDDTTVLVGFVGHSGNRKIEEVLDAYIVRNENALKVLSCPRYVYDHLNQVAGTQGSYTGWFMTSAPAPADPAVAEVAAALWDPSSRLGNMHAAIEAAEAAVA